MDIKKAKHILKSNGILTKNGRIHRKDALAAAHILADHMPEFLAEIKAYTEDYFKDLGISGKATAKAAKELVLGKSIKPRNPKSSTDGKIPHNHPLERDDEGKIIGHGPANSGPAHEHSLVRERSTGKVVQLGPPGNTDPGDPEHTHKV